MAGIMDNIFDGIQRPLESIAQESGNSIFIPRGINVPALNKQKQWTFTPTPGFSVGKPVTQGDVYATVPESIAVQHKVLQYSTAQGLSLRILCVLR